MPKPIVGDISLQEVLKKDGFSLVDSRDDGGLVVRDQNNFEEYTIADPKEYIASYLNENEPEMLEKFSIDNFNISINDAETPLQTAPVDFADRAAMSVGNIKGNVEYLKQKFDDVKVNKQGQIVVSKNSRWHSIDPDGLGNGDAFDLASEFAGDVADIIGETITIGSSLVGDIAGAAAGGVPGLIAGGAAGAAVGETIRTSLGRIVGTYDESVEGQIADAGVEALLALGGYGIGAVATKVGKKAFNMATKNVETLPMLGALRNFKNAPRDVKDALAGFVSFTTGKSPRAAERLVKNPEGVTARLNELTRNPADYGDIVTSARKQSLGDLQEFLEGSVKGFGNAFNRAETDVLAEVGAKKLNLGSAIDDMGQGIQSDAFLGQFVQKLDNGKLAVKPMGQVNFAKDVDTAAAVNAVQAPLRRFVNQLNALNGKPSASAKEVLTLRRELDKIVYGDGTTKGIPANLRPMFTEYTSKVRSQLAEFFQNSPAGEKYMSMNKMYIDNMNILDEARKVVGSNDLGKMESFLKKTLSNGTEGTRIKIDGLSQYASGETRKKFDRILDRESALEFMQVFPHFKNLAGGPAIVLGAAGGLVASDQVDPLTGFGAAAMVLSPRLMAKGVSGVLRSGAKLKRVGNRFGAAAGQVQDKVMGMNEMIKRLTPSQKAELRNSPDALMRLLGPIMTGAN